MKFVTNFNFYLLRNGYNSDYILNHNAQNCFGHWWKFGYWLRDGCRFERKRLPRINGRDAESVHKAASTLRCEGVVADLQNPDDIRSLAQRFATTGLDFLVNNAGIA